MQALNHARVKHCVIQYVMKYMDRDVAKIVYSYLNRSEWMSSYRLAIPAGCEWKQVVGVSRDAIYWHNATTLFKNQDTLLERTNVSKVTRFHDTWLLVEFGKHIKLSEQTTFINNQITIFDEITRFSTTFPNIDSACVWQTKVFFVEIGRSTIQVYDVVTKLQKQWMSWQEYTNVKRNHDTVVAKCEYGWTNIHTNKGCLGLARYEYKNETYIVQPKFVSRENGSYGLELICEFHSKIITHFQFKHSIVIVIETGMKYVIDMINHTWNAIVLPSQYKVTHNQLYALSPQGAIDVFD